ncbi:hypothetical protein [Pseudanabaena sp. Chao 1811]|uniref:hypothetical protein n=1 Tax=Pseudanabaena sp. Chao 1811 TaxID=2963092 RepID=UPI0022F3E8B3|nr:hypothetical protein [Pseudanabaena sp. Chao 1811]
MRQKIVESPQELEEVGNTLLMVLDKVTEFNKPRLLGNLFVAYLDNIISKEDMLRLIYAVEVAFADDLRKLIQNGTASDVGSHLEFLVPSGLSCVVAGGWSNMGSSSTEVSYKTTILANKMLQAYYHVNGTPNL